VKRAQALERGARLAQLDGLADQVYEIDLLLDLSGYAYGRGGPPGLFAARLICWDAALRPVVSLLVVTRRWDAPDTRMALSSLDKAHCSDFTP
jgi:hypothetical protein